METKLTTCALDCPDGCSVEVTVDSGKIARLDAPKDSANPLTAGWICAKVKQTPALVHGDSRIMEPMRRVGPKDSGDFEAISWDTALDMIVERIETAVGSEGWSSIAPYLYSSSAGMLGRTGLSPLVWEALGSARVDATICAATSSMAWDLTYGGLLPADPGDIEFSTLFVSWGANPTVSNSHYASIINRRRREGLSLVVIDPRRTPIAARADLHLAVRPGTDVVLAMSVAHILERDGRIDEAFTNTWVSGVDEYLAACEPWAPERAAQVCGLDMFDIERFADMYASSRPSLLRVGWGTERNQNGGSAIRAVLSLPALAGQFGVRGSGVFHSVGAPGSYRQEDLRAAVLGDAIPGPRRPINMNRLGKTLTEDEGGRVEVLLVQGSNPAATCPEQAVVLEGLARTDLFTVVHDFTMTDTARFADVVLPATTQFEVDEVVDPYGAFMELDAPAVIPRVGESRTNDEVSTAIGIRLGLDAHTWDPSPTRIRRLAMRNRTVPVRTVDPGSRIQFSPRNSVTVNLVADQPDVDRVPTYRAVNDTFPLTLISPATNKTITTMFGGLKSASSALRLNVDDAQERRLGDGDRAIVTNGRHSIEVTVAIGSELRRGVASMPKGMWRKDGDGGLTVNALVPDTLADLAGGATFNDARVEVTGIPTTD